ncbi:MAG: response regulator [Anaerolineae bacterium]|nr:response regulator [Thermoflexus sp.]MDW8064909.1 response regulator [Anaerolineae bacterium]
MARVLVVDDDPDARRLIGLVLRRAGHEVLYAGDGVQALEIISQERPDLMILDLMMPGMDGLEVLKAARQRTERATLPVIVLTAKPQTASAADLSFPNVHAHLTKPVSAETLLRAVQEALEPPRPVSVPESRVLEIACGESWPGSAGELLASALACALATNTLTLLADVEGLGRGAMIFDLEPRMTVEDLEAGRDPVQGLIPVHERLQVWSVYGRPSPAVVEWVAKRLAPQAGFLVWMVGDPSKSVAVSIFPQCRRIFFTFESHGPGMRRARLVLRQLEELGLRSPRVQPVWVRRGVAPEQWTEIDVQNRLGGVPIRVWPVDPAVAYRALQRGQSIQEIEPESPSARRIQEWAREILGLSEG